MCISFLTSIATVGHIVIVREPHSAQKKIYFKRMYWAFYYDVANICCCCCFFLCVYIGDESPCSPMHTDRNRRREKLEMVRRVRCIKGPTGYQIVSVNCLSSITKVVAFSAKKNPFFQNVQIGMWTHFSFR